MDRYSKEPAKALFYVRKTIIKKAFHSLKKIGYMAKDILEILICLIGYICEKTESCYICKALVSESADVTVIKLSLIHIWHLARWPILSSRVLRHPQFP